MKKLEKCPLCGAKPVWGKWGVLCPNVKCVLSFPYQGKEEWNSLARLVRDGRLKRAMDVVFRRLREGNAKFPPADYEIVREQAVEDEAARRKRRAGE